MWNQGLTTLKEIGAVINKYMLFTISLLFGLLSLTGCNPPADSFATLNQSQGYSGYIIVANSLTRSVSLLDSEGAPVRGLLTLDRTSTEWPAGIALSSDNQSVLIAIEGTDRVAQVNLDGSNLNGSYILNANLTGTLRGIAVLASGYVLISEGAAIEQFISPTLRNTVGWPIAPMTGGTAIRPIASTGGFLYCSFTTDAVRTYTSAGVQVDTQVSGVAATTDAMGCAVSSAGRVGVSWSGTTDTIKMYPNLTLTNTGAVSYSNLTLMPAPHGIDFLPNGNMLVADLTTNLLVEISTTGTLVRTIASPAVAGPVDLLVVP